MSQPCCDKVVIASGCGPNNIAIYTGDGPPAFSPSYPNLPAMAYPDAGDKPTYTWSIALQQWK